MSKRKKIIELKIYIEANNFEANLKHTCKTSSLALDIIQQFVDRHRKGESIDGKETDGTQNYTPKHER